MATLAIEDKAVATANHSQGKFDAICESMENKFKDQDA